MGPEQEGRGRLEQQGYAPLPPPPAGPRNELRRGPEPEPVALPGDAAWPHRRQWLGRLPVDPLRLAEALAVVEALAETGRGGAVLLPTADHLVLAEADEALRAAYARADLCLADGQRLVWTAETLGRPLPEDVPAGELLPPLMALAGRRRWRVFLVGLDGPGLDAAAARLESGDGVRVVGTHLLPDARAPDAKVTDHAARAVLRAAPQLVLVAAPSPLQELLIDRLRDRVRPGVMVGLGAALPELTRRGLRTPPLLRRLGLGWLLRLIAGPRRLGRRGLWRDARFLWTLARLLLAERRSGESRRLA